MVNLPLVQNDEYREQVALARILATEFAEILAKAVGKELALLLDENSSKELKSVDPSTALPLK